MGNNEVSFDSSNKSVTDKFAEYSAFEDKIAYIRGLSINEVEQDELIKIEYSILKESKFQDLKNLEERNITLSELFVKYKKVSSVDLNSIDTIEDIKEAYAFIEDVMNTVKALASIEKNIKIINFVESADFVSNYDAGMLEYYESLLASIELNSDEEDKSNAQAQFYSCASYAVSLFQQIMLDEQMFYEAFGFPNFEALEKHTLEMFNEKSIKVS